MYSVICSHHGDNKLNAKKKKKKKEVQKDHVIDHMTISQGHVPASQGHMGEFLSSLFDYNLALGSGWMDLEFPCVIPS